MIEKFDGLPPAGEPGQFLGFDEDGAVYVIWWSENFWQGVGQDKHRLGMAFGFLARGEMAGFIRKWARPQ